MNTKSISKTRHQFPSWKIAAVAALALVPALPASPAAAAPTRSGYHARIHHAGAPFRHSYARAYAAAPAYVEPGWDAPFVDAPYGYGGSVYGYNCGIGLSGTPLACEPGD